MGASILFFVVHAALVAVLQSKETGVRRFNGYQVFSIEATTPGQLELLRDLYLSGDYDFWTTPSVLGYTDVMVAPEQIKGIVTISNNAKMKYIIKIADFETLVSKERIANLKAGSGRISWDRYPRFAEIETWLNNLNSPYVTVSLIGHSYNGLDLHAVKFSTGGAPKKTVLIDANINGREWVTGATATWIINELITNTTTYLDVLQQIDIHIIPMVNPDAYEISHTEDRLWTKTRSINDGSDCLGSDPNRNFAFMFGLAQTEVRLCGKVGAVLVPGDAVKAILLTCREVKLVKMSGFLIKGRDKFQGFIDANRLPITLSE